MVLTITNSFTNSITLGCLWSVRMFHVHTLKFTTYVTVSVCIHVNLTLFHFNINQTTTLRTQRWIWQWWTAFILFSLLNSLYNKILYIVRSCSSLSGRKTTDVTPRLQNDRCLACGTFHRRGVTDRQTQQTTIYNKNSNLNEPKFGISLTQHCVAILIGE